MAKERLGGLGGIEAPVWPGLGGQYKGVSRGFPITPGVSFGLPVLFVTVWLVGDRHESPLDRLSR